jgi:hypothetical protein
VRFKAVKNLWTMTAVYLFLNNFNYVPPKSLATGLSVIHINIDINFLWFISFNQSSGLGQHFQIEEDIVRISRRNTSQSESPLHANGVGSFGNGEDAAEDEVDDAYVNLTVKVDFRIRRN